VGALVVSGRAPRAGVAAIGALLALPACGALDFRSRLPHAAHDPDLDVSVDDVVVAKMVQPEFEEHFGVRLGATMTARPGAAWGAPRINTASRPRCEGGLASTSDATFALAPGQPQHSLLVFSGEPKARAAPFVDGTAVLDVPVFPADQTQPHRCLRVPLQEMPAGAEWQATPWMLGLDLRLVFLAQPLRGYQDNAVLIALPQGWWVDRWRFSLAFEGGLVGERGVVPPTPPPDAHPSVGVLGGNLQVGRMLWNADRVGLDAQLGYDLLWTTAPNKTSAAAPAYEAALLHGPRLALRFLLLKSARPDWQGFRAPPDATAFGISAFAGAWWQSSGAAAPAPIFGLSLDGNVGI
jgi:hypothetical protein